VAAERLGRPQPDAAEIILRLRTNPDAAQPSTPPAPRWFFSRLQEDDEPKRLLIAAPLTI
jgi:hypothetical protein